MHTENNIAELDALLKDVDLGLQWKATGLHLFMTIRVSRDGYQIHFQERPAYTLRLHLKEEKLITK